MERGEKAGVTESQTQLVKDPARRNASMQRTMALLGDAVQALHAQAGWPYHRMHLFGYAQVCGRVGACVD